MPGLESVATVRVWHACGHTEFHALATTLPDDVRDQVLAKLSRERCWRCLVSEAWEDLAPWR